MKEINNLVIWYKVTNYGQQYLLYKFRLQKHQNIKYSLFSNLFDKLNVSRNST